MEIPAGDAVFPEENDHLRGCYTTVARSSAGSVMHDMRLLLRDETVERLQ